MSYLRRAEVTATMRAISGLSAPGSRLVVNYQAPSLFASLGRSLARAMTTPTRRLNPWANEPVRSSWTPAAMADLLRRHGFEVRRDDDLLSLAEALPMAVRQRRSLKAGHVTVADR